MQQSFLVVGAPVYILKQEVGAAGYTMRPLYLTIGMKPFESPRGDDGRHDANLYKKFLVAMLMDGHVCWADGDTVVTKWILQLALDTAAVNGKQLNNLYLFRAFAQSLCLARCPSDILTYSEIVAPDGDVTRFTLAGIVNQECAEHKGNAACNSNWPVGKKSAVPKKNVAYPKPIMGLVTIAARELSSAIRATAKAVITIRELQVQHKFPSCTPLGDVATRFNGVRTVCRQLDKPALNEIIPLAIVRWLEHPHECDWLGPVFNAWAAWRALKLQEQQIQFVFSPILEMLPRLGSQTEYRGGAIACVFGVYMNAINATRAKYPGRRHVAGSRV